MIALQWFVDGVQVAGAAGELFDLRDWGFGPGEYDVTVRAFDTAGFDDGAGFGSANWWVRRGSENLEQFVSWQVNVAAAPEPGAILLILFAAGGAITLRRRSSLHGVALEVLDVVGQEPPDPVDEHRGDDVGVVNVLAAGPYRSEQ